MKQQVIWRKISHDLIRNINLGVWNIGDLLPPEIELAAKYRVGRDTMRKAMAYLTKEGFVQRTPHVGTRVVARHNDDAFTHEMSSLRAIDEYGNQYPRTIQDAALVSLSAEEASRLMLPEGMSQFRFTNTRTDSKTGNAVVVTYVYINPNERAVYDLAVAHPNELIISLLERQTGRDCIEIRQTISATTMPDIVADAFALSHGVPALVVVRRYMDNKGATLASSISYHPGNQYSFTFSAKRQRSRNY